MPRSENANALESGSFAAPFMHVVLRTMPGRREKARPGGITRPSAGLGLCAGLRAAPACFRGAFT